MSTPRSRFVVMFVCLFALSTLLGCRERRHEPAGTVQTQTIAPAAAQPSPTGTDAMTQTVDVEDGRSVDDGGVVAERPATTTAPAAGAPSAKKKGKKK
jgi:hypothetical protein